MSLRRLKRTGGFLQQSVAPGVWVTYGPGQLAKCPAPQCGQGIIQADAYSEIMIRIAEEGIGDPRQPSGYTLCPDGRCKTRLQIRIDSSEVNPNQPSATRIGLV